MNSICCGWNIVHSGNDISCGKPAIQFLLHWHKGNPDNEVWTTISCFRHSINFDDDPDAPIITKEITKNEYLAALVMCS